MRASVVVALLLTPLAAPLHAATLDSFSAGDRNDETVVLSGAQLASLAGRVIDDLSLYRFDSASGFFAPIPFQLDERFLKVFDQGLPSEFSEMVYDVFGEDDGFLDTDDELVFLMGDAGDRAPIEGAWIGGADPLRFEIEIEDPQAVGGGETQWVYLFTGTGLPGSAASYVSWDGQANSSVTTDVFRLDYDGNWLMTGLTVFGPCGSGVDALDRFKGRADPGVGEVRQDEEDWSENSTYLGGLAGPLRAIRYVRGARSGVNTIHHDVIARSAWNRSINLRVHPLASVTVYFDWLPAGGAMLFTSEHPGGLLVDGVPDGAASTTFADWHLMRTTTAGLFVGWEVPLSGLFQAREFFYIDDANHDDTVPGKAVYPDDDDAAYGSHGVHLVATQDSNLSPIQIRFSALPLCAGEGDAALAQTLQQQVDQPLQPNATPQSACGAVRSMTVRRDGDDAVLEWDAAESAEAYRVYWAASPDLPAVSWTLAGETPGLSFRDVGAATAPSRFYSVVCISQGGEGPW